jgi:hypothetical protein
MGERAVYDPALDPNLLKGDKRLEKARNRKPTYKDIIEKVRDNLYYTP